MGELAEWVKEHPAAIGVAVVVVALLAFYQSKTEPQPTDGELVVVGGGTGSREIDPGVVAIEQARIDAGSRNLGTLSSLILGSEQTREASGVRHSEIDASLTSDLARTESSRTTTLADITARRDVSMASVAAQIDLANISAAQARDLAGINSELQRYTSNLTAQLTRENAAREYEQAKLAYTRDLEALATQRDVARVQAKSDFWGDAFGVVGDVVSFFNPFD